jgi:hypothetical protein
MAQKRIDIIQEFVDLYKREEMLAFFEFRVGGPNGTAGLCRVSTQKGGAAGGRYLSLTFLIDAPDEGTRAVADEALNRIEDAAVHAELPAVIAVVSIPAMIDRAESYIRQVDLMLDESTAVERSFVADRLVPLVLRLTGMTAGAVEWWDEVAQVQPSRSAEAVSDGPPSRVSVLLARLRK